MRSQKSIQMAEIALMSAVLCVLAPIAIPLPMSPVPLTLATFAVYLTAALLGAKKGMCSVMIYLLLGMIGLPVFSGFSGGIGKLLGPTGGYAMGYLPCALVIGWLVERGINGEKQRSSATEDKAGFKHWQTVLWNAFSMVLGTMLCYVLGTAWFLMVMEGTYTLAQALLVCVVPYLVFDMIKIMAAAAFAVPVRKILWRIEK